MVVEGDFAAHQNIDDDSEAPYVHLGAGVRLCLQQLGGGEIQAAAEGLETVTAGAEEVAQTKVDNLDVVVLADQYVLDLQVSVHDAVPMAVVDGARDLTGEASGVLLLELAMRDDVIKHLTTVHILEEHIPVPSRPDVVAESTDVGVVQHVDESRLARIPDLSGLVGGFSFFLAGTAVFVGHSFNDLAGDLGTRRWLVMRWRYQAVSGGGEGGFEEEKR